MEGQVKSDNRLVNGVVSGLGRTNRAHVNAMRSTGATNVDSYVSSLKKHEPRVSTPKVTSRSGTITGSLRVTSKSRPGNGVSRMAYATKDLDVAAEAHVDNVLTAIDTLESTLP